MGVSTLEWFGHVARGCFVTLIFNGIPTINSTTYDTSEPRLGTLLCHLRPYKAARLGDNLGIRYCNLRITCIKLSTDLSISLFSFSILLPLLCSVLGMHILWRFLANYM